MRGFLAAVAIAVLFFLYWTWKRPVSPSGGLWFPKRVVLSVPAFRQNDPRWGKESLGPAGDTLGSAGCAVTSAAMVLSFYGIGTDPHRLNLFLSQTGGYTSEGWLRWEGAAALSPFGVRHAYEDLPSYCLIDWNLLRGNPVIVRIRLKGGTTHFVVIVGKQGWDYLILDPGGGWKKGVYPFKELGVPIRALRFYRHSFDIRPIQEPFPYGTLASCESAWTLIK